MRASAGRRLVAEVRGGRRYVVGLAVGGLLTAVLVPVQAELLAEVLARAADGVAGPVGLLAVVGCLRAAVGWGVGRHAARSAGRAKAVLRGRVLGRLRELGPQRLTEERRGELTTLLGRGLDALDGYFTGYLPQLVVAALVPVAVLVRLVVADWESALIVAVTLPLIPVFGALVGLHTRDATERQWAGLRRLGGHFLDVIAGLPTLRAFGRAKAQAEMIRAMADAHRLATLRTLRIAFLSALVLELAASLSVALVAVPVGLRLLDGELTLRRALLLLILAPEAYLPLRALGSSFHASAEGLAVARQVFELLDAEQQVVEPLPQVVGPVLRGAVSIEFEDVGVGFPGRNGPVLREVGFTAEAGRRTALVGPSGGGKSTLLALVLGLVTPERGRVLVNGVDLARLDLAEWRRQVTWVPQRPHLFGTTVAENIGLGLPDASPDRIRLAAAQAGAARFIEALPHGYATVLGERGLGLSAGQRQRIALARAFLRDTPVVLLDEPTAGLDRRTEADFLAAGERLMAGRTVLVVAHRPALLAGADQVLEVDRGRVAPARPALAGRAL